MSPRIVFNGKFLAAAPTGVHRVAHELIEAADRAIGAGQDPTPAARWELLCPPDANGPIALDHIRRRRVGPLTWQFWEQFELPVRVRGALLVSLCNLAPLTARGQVTMIHDAQVFISPESYSGAFAAWYRFALPRIGRIAARILTVSEFSRSQLVAYGVAPRERITVIHNGADHVLRVSPDPAAAARLGLASGRYVVALANTQKHKNIRVLLEAFAGAQPSGLKLVLVGPATAADFAAAGHNPPDGVIFAGRVSDAELRHLVENALCLCCPSTTEGFGLPPLEAMLLDCPAVVAPCGALPEVCGEAALYAQPDEPALWRQAILALAEDPALRDRRKALGRAHAARFTWDKAGRELLAVLDEVSNGIG